MPLRPERIKVEPLSFGTLMYQMELGQLRVPRFQRNFVWEKIRIQTLLDSMYKEYPIGTIFLWKAPAKYNHMLRYVDYLRQEPIESEHSYTFILDGQQRLTSLYVTTQGLSIRGENYGKIVADLAAGEDEAVFQYRNPDSKRWVAIRDLLQANNFALFNDLPSEYRPRFIELQQRLTNYPFSVVTVSSMDLPDAIEIFERINQQSKRLTRYDLIAASVLTDSFDLRERTQHDIIRPLKTTFGEIAETNIPQVLALNIKRSTEYETQMALEVADVQAVWDRTVECMKLAVDFVHTNLGVKRSDFLPYNAILPVLAHYFYEGETNSIKSSAHREQLEKWFWRAAFSERYGGSSQTTMTEDARMIRQLASEDRPLGLGSIPVSIDEQSLIQSSMRSTTSAVRNGILCLLSLQHPLHFANQTEINISGDYFSKFTRAERHHIFPLNYLREQGYRLPQVHLVPNFCFIPSDLNNKISDRAPSVYFGELKILYGTSGTFEKVMQTHLIPIDASSGIWTNDYKLFLSQRARLIMTEIRLRCGLSSRISEEQRNPILDDIEIGLRDAIHTALSNALGLEYWKQAIPDDIRQRIDERIDVIIRNAPGTSKSQYKDVRRLLTLCDVGDYPKIILSGANWKYFSPMFRSKADCERMLNDFRLYRNSVKHNQEIDTLQDLRGQAAIIWISRALEIDLTRYGIE